MLAMNQMCRALMRPAVQSRVCQLVPLPGLVQGHRTCLTVDKPTASSCLPSRRNLYQYMSKESLGDHSKDADHVVDLRSDTVTKPTPEMRQAMMDTDVGDDVMREDPTINKLQERVAKMFGKEDALFVPTGTMANLIAVMCHCHGRAEEVILGDESHIILYEQGALATVGGVHTRQVKNLPDGTMDLNEVRAAIRGDDIHFPKTRAIIIENTHNNKGGRAVPLSFMKELRELTKEHGISVHLDGARVMNAVCALGVEPIDIGQYADSISMCFSKGLAAPVGSALIGTKEFIDRARMLRKGLGGGMRQAGVLAACALVALDKSVPRLHEDHKNARRLAQGLRDIESNMVTSDPSVTDTNMVVIHLREGTNMSRFMKAITKVYDDETAVNGSKLLIRIFPAGPMNLRAVIHYHITSADIERTLKKFKFVCDLIDAGKINVGSSGIM